jgi:hypothetical protein
MLDEDCNKKKYKTCHDDIELELEFALVAKCTRTDKKAATALFVAAIVKVNNAYDTLS